MLNKKIKRLLITIFISIILLVFFFLYYHLSTKYHIGIKCIFHEITGLYCPGCGMTRAIFSLSRLEIYKAFRYNALIFLVIPFFIYYYTKIIYYWIIDKKHTKDILSNKTWYILLIITITYGLLRNISIFSFMAPTK